jgi:hypothetical protein
VNSVDGDAVWAPSLYSPIQKEIEQLEHLEQPAKIKGLRRSTAMEPGAAGPEQQQCFCTLCKLSRTPLHLHLHLVQKRWNEATPEHGYPE